MEKIYFNKLVRDNIPKKLESKGCKFEIQELDEENFKRELLKKVGEEASGLLSAKNDEELVSEIADIVAVIDEIKRHKKITNEQLMAVQKENFEKKGGFKKRLFLVWTSDDGYKTNEIKYDEKKD